jgi:hypothetical protein
VIEGLRSFRRRHRSKLNRLRWIRKRGLLREYGVPLRSDLRRNLAYLLWDPEIDNFTYDLGNVDEVVGFLAESLGASRAEVDRCVREPLADKELHAMLRARTRPRRLSTKRLPGFGRRLGWYAIARLRRPSLIVETGIHDGLGSALLLRALDRNARDGLAEGSLISFDPRPETGWMVPDELRHRWEPHFVTSQQGMEEALEGSRVDFFIHDSDHTYEVERFEFETALRNRAPDCVLLSDNSHGTSALEEMSAEIGSPYAFFPEKPRHHWYPGAGIGLVVSARAS